MRNRITFQIIFSVAALIIAVRIFVNATNMIADFSAYNDGRTKNLTYVSQLVSDQEKQSAKTYDELFKYLEVVKISNLIDFYQIEENGAVKFKTANVGDFDTKVPADGAPKIVSGLHFTKLHLSKFDVVMGFFGESSNAYWLSTKRNLPFILLDLFLLILVVALTVRFRLAVLTSISKILGQLTPKDIESVNHPSLEIRTIVNFLRSFIDEHFKSEQQRNLFKRNLADGILNELFTSKKKPPYEISAVLVRFDMNNYSRRALQENTEQFTALLSRYFKKVKELRFRYGGLDYQFIGDEKVLFFKINSPEQLEPQMLSAIAFLRDSFSLAKEMSTGLPLTFKASVVPGKLVFYELDDSHYFAGAPLIESARYLSTISEKDRSILSLSSSFNDKVSLLTKPFNTESVLLKGYDTECSISYFDQFDSTYTTKKNPNLFLSDTGLIQILDQLTIAINQLEFEPFFEIFQQIRSIRTEDVDLNVALKFEQFLAMVIEKYKSIDVDNRRLSCAVALCWVFVPVGFETGQIKDLLYSLIRHKDVRVASNSLIASQRYEWNQDIIEKMLSSPSNRLRGDTLVLLGRRGVDQKFFRAWKELVENSDTNFILSGLYASQEVFKFHVDNNPTHLKSNPLVGSMIEIIEKLIHNPKSNIVQRAQWALDVVRVESGTESNS